MGAQDWAPFGSEVRGAGELEWSGASCSHLPGDRGATAGPATGAPGVPPHRPGGP